MSLFTLPGESEQQEYVPYTTWITVNSEGPTVNFSIGGEEFVLKGEFANREQARKVESLLYNTLKKLANA